MAKHRSFPNMTLNTTWMDGFLQVAMALALLNFAAQNVHQPTNLPESYPSFQPARSFAEMRDVKPIPGAETLLEQLLSLEGSFHRREIQPHRSMFAMPTTFNGAMPFHRQSSCDSDELSLLSAADASGPTEAFYRPGGSSPFSSSACSSASQDVAGSDDLSAYSPRFTLNDFDLDLLDLTKEENAFQQDHNDNIDSTKKQSLKEFTDINDLEVALSKLQGTADEVFSGMKDDFHPGLEDFTNFNSLSLPPSCNSSDSQSGALSEEMLCFDQRRMPIFPGQDQITEEDINDLLASSFPDEDTKPVVQQDKTLLLPETENGQANSDFKLCWDGTQQGSSFDDINNLSPETAGKDLLGLLGGLSETEVTEMPVEKFNSWIKSLEEPQVELAKDLRRKGKNKQAARNCRKRKFDAIGGLEDEIEEMKRKQEDILEERQRLLAETNDLHKSTQWLHEYIFESLRDDQGQQFSKDDYTLQYTSDGGVYLVPNRLAVQAGRSVKEPTSSDSVESSSEGDAQR